MLGLVLGALFGLGAALAVAVYVTKVPIPFLNKGGSRGSQNDAAEAQKNRDWDPNAALSGKNAARPPAATGNQGTLETPAVGVPSPAVVITPPQASASAARAAGRAASSDPLGDLANARSAARPAVPADTAESTSTGADPFNYFIQVGAFRTPEDAEQQRAKLLLLGFQARVTEREQSGRTVYRVRLGPFDKKDDADKAKERLDGVSVETALVRVQR